MPPPVDRKGDKSDNKKSAPPSSDKKDHQSENKKSESPKEMRMGDHEEKTNPNQKDSELEGVAKKIMDNVEVNEDPESESFYFPVIGGKY